VKLIFEDDIISIFLNGRNNENDNVVNASRLRVAFKRISVFKDVTCEFLAVGWLHPDRWDPHGIGAAPFANQAKQQEDSSTLDRCTLHSDIHSQP
jgi:hypothetical protein